MVPTRELSVKKMKKIRKNQGRKLKTKSTENRKCTAKK